MITFTIAKKEQEVLDELIKALLIVYGDYDELKRTYHFTHSGIGVKSEVTLFGYKDRVKIFEISKDITNYDNW